MSFGAAQLTCGSSNRRSVLREEEHSTGIDFVEVSNSGVITLHLLNPPEDLSEAHIAISKVANGEPIDDVTVVRGSAPAEWKVSLPAAAAHQTTVRYQLSLGNLPFVDPLHAETEFSVPPSGQPLTTDEDPLKEKECSPSPIRDPEINYLARDFQSLRQVMLDRLALIMPDWKERHAADLGMTLVELLAYIGDHLSYYQDAVATEAYLGTARSRISVKRHARLVDYNLHEGCNARTFLQLEVARDMSYEPENVYFITEPQNRELKEKSVLAHRDLEFEAPDSYLGFETMATPISSETIEQWHCVDWKRFATRFLRSGGMRAATRLLDAPSDSLLTAGALLYRFVRPAAYSELLETLRRAADKCPLWEMEDECPAAVRRHLPALRRRFQKSPDLLQRINLLYLQLAYPDCFSFTRSVTDRRPPKFQGADEDLIFSELQPQSVKLFAAHNVMRFYTWDQQECCLPAGATSATLIDERAPLRLTDAQDEHRCAPAMSEPRDQWLKLRAGDFLLLKEVRGAGTGNPADADPAKRQVVRLTSVCYTVDPVSWKNIVEIKWSYKDRLKFPLCISSTSTRGEQLDNVSVACGNIIVVDHGIRVNDPVELGHVQGFGGNHCTSAGCTDSSGAEQSRRKHRVDFVLPETAGLTFAQPVAEDAAAADVRRQKTHQAHPELDVIGIPVDPAAARIHEDQPRRSLFELDDLETPVAAAVAVQNISDNSLGAVLDLLPPQVDDIVHQLKDDRTRPRVKHCDCLTLVQQLRRAMRWLPRNSLIDSTSADRHFAVEVDEQRRAHLRFGNGEEGRRPQPETRFVASYRVGNGTIGNIGQDKLKVVVYRDTPVSGILSVNNPLPAGGGTDPESMERARIHAPHAFRKLDRAILPEDYRALVMRDFSRQVQQVRVTAVKAGHRTIITIAMDFFEGVQDQGHLLTEIERRLRRYAGIKHDVAVKPASPVDVLVNLKVVLRPGFLIGDVRDELLHVLGTGTSPDGQQGFFHPDRLSFDHAIHSGQIIGLGLAVAGVADLSVDLKKAESTVPDTDQDTDQDADQDRAGGFTNTVLTFSGTQIPRVTVTVIQKGRS